MSSDRWYARVAVAFLTVLFMAVPAQASFFQRATRVLATDRVPPRHARCRRRRHRRCPPRPHPHAHPPPVATAIVPGAPVLPIGVEDDPTFVLNSNDQALGYARAAGLHASWMHIVAHYNHPLPPRAYASDRAREHGMKVEVTLTGQRVNMPATAAQYGAWCKQAATEVPADAYSMWNEPDIWDWWPRSVVEYRAFYMACRAAVKLVRPSAQVWAGETSAGAESWLKSLLGSGGMPPADGYSHHPYHWSDYSRPIPPDFLGMERLAELRKLIGGMPLYLTEFGYFASDPGRAWLPCRSLAEARAAGARLVVWYMLYPQSSHKWDMAMLNPDGSPTAEYQALSRCT